MKTAFPIAFVLFYISILSPSLKPVDFRGTFGEETFNMDTSDYIASQSHPLGSTEDSSKFL